MRILGGMVDAPDSKSEGLDGRPGSTPGGSTAAFPPGVRVTDKRGNPDPYGFGGIVVDAPEFTALIPPGCSVKFEALEALAKAVQQKVRT